MKLFPLSRGMGALRRQLRKRRSRQSHTRFPSSLQVEPLECRALLATVPILEGILMYHAPGFRSNGCYRFGMDYVPIWLMAAGPALVAPRLRWWTLGCVAWSVVYFQMLALN